MCMLLGLLFIFLSLDHLGDVVVVVFCLSSARGEVSLRRSYSLLLYSWGA